MVQVFKHTHRYDDSPQTALLAFYLRYPNPFASHVLSCDVISRAIDPTTGRISTQRLILKKGIVPRWARTWLENFGMMGGGGLEAWVLEESEVWVDPRTGELRLKSMTRNISHKKLMHVAEGTELESAAPNSEIREQRGTGKSPSSLPVPYDSGLTGPVSSPGTSRNVPHHDQTKRIPSTTKYIRSGGDGFLETGVARGKG
ncbi:hypothetical protein QFC20_000801 [Naganishia adeliensis]|uniref:Uncharacterized protein n=1 Tax=Naganishia adeliensis TaxID=92952 RepID=A0ACC2WWI6_9TREE|nr:hypothetical protein QFC20_000801 [Naganishia adeliensis]